MMRSRIVAGDLKEVSWKNKQCQLESEILEFGIWGVKSFWFREDNGTPLQYSCLENPMDGGAWWAAVHGVAKSWT